MRYKTAVSNFELMIPKTTINMRMYIDSYDEFVDGKLKCPNNILRHNY